MGDAVGRFAPGQIVHCALDIRGALRRLHASRAKWAPGMTRDDGRPLLRTEAIEALFDELALGRRVLPVGEPCEGWSYQTGCPRRAGPASVAMIDLDEIRAVRERFLGGDFSYAEVDDAILALIAEVERLRNAACRVLESVGVGPDTVYAHSARGAVLELAAAAGVTPQWCCERHAEPWPRQEQPAPPAIDARDAISDRLHALGQRHGVERTASRIAVRLRAGADPRAVEVDLGLPRGTLEGVVCG